MYPHNIPSFPSAQRSPFQDNVWRPSRSPVNNVHNNRLPGYGLSQGPSSNSGSGSSSLSNKLSGFFGGGSSGTLPMYKDKPYFAPRRTGPGLHRRRKLVYGGIWTIFILILLWYYVGGLSLSSIWQRFGLLKGSEVAEGVDLWNWMQNFGNSQQSDKDDVSFGGKTKKKVDWESRREKVRDAFIVSFDDYQTHAWGTDEYHPLSKTGKQMIEDGMGWIIVDALDTMMMMNLTSRVQQARHWIHHSLRYDQNHDVNTFETSIRMLGGLLSAHYLSTTYPDLAPISDDDVGSPGEDLYIEKATDLANRLIGAFDSKTGIPYASVNLNTSTGIPSHADNGASSTAEATTVQLEFKYLAKLTGEAEFWKTVENVMKVVDDQKMEDGLLPIFLYADTGKFRGNYIRLGSRGDSYYEYLIKQYLQTSKQEPIYKEMWDEALTGIRKHLITYSKRAQLTILAERPDGLRGSLLPKMDHLVCFLPGTIALGATGGLPVSEAKKSPEWSVRQDEEILLAKELMKTCWTSYLATKTGLAPEITYFDIDEPPVMTTDMYPDSTLTKGNRKSSGEDLHLISKPLYPLEDVTLPWKKDIQIQPQDRHNLQRPETVESLFYMYRITGDETYRHWGWEMFKSFIKHTAVIKTDEEDSSSSKDKPTENKAITKQQQKQKENPTSRIVGFTSLSNTDTIPPVQRDNMESFWLAETLKYLYLLFSDRKFLSLEENVFNTEAHPFPRFRLGGDLRTGWARQRRS